MSASSAQCRLTTPINRAILTGIESFLEDEEKLYVLSEEKKDRHRRYEILYYSRANEVRATISYYLNDSTVTITEIGPPAASHKYFHRLCDRFRTAVSADDLLHQPLSPIMYRAEMLPNLLAAARNGQYLNLANYSYKLGVCIDLIGQADLPDILTAGLRTQPNRRHVLTVLANLLRCQHVPDSLVKLGEEIPLRPDDDIHTHSEHRRLKNALLQRSELNLPSASSQ